MKAESVVQVVVRSRRVPIGTVIRTQPVYSANGVLVGSHPSTFVLYGTSLDGEHRRAIEEAQKLACSLGMELEVVDESRSGLLSRFLSRFGINGRSPAVVVPPSPAMAASDPSPTVPNGC
jgi:hypothetical protein